MCALAIAQLAAIIYTAHEPRPHRTINVQKAINMAKVLSSSKIHQSPAGDPLSMYREAQGNYQEFGTEVSFTIDD